MKITYYVKKAKNMYIHLIWTPINIISFWLNGIKFGKGLRVRGKVYSIFHTETASIEIGKNVYFNSASWANPIGCGDSVYIQMIESGKLLIGDGCGISNCAFTCANRIEIGKNVLLGSGCRIFDTDFHPLDYRERVRGNYPGAPIKTAPIVIEDGVFVGAGSYILKGVHIGKHSIVGAGSVVTKDIPPYEIWAGNPARFIRKVIED